MRPFIPLLVGILSISGCHSPSEPLPYPMTLDSESLGPLKLGETFDIASLQGKLPGFSIEKMSKITPGNDHSLLALKRGNTLLAYIFPDQEGKRIETITVISGLISDANGQTVGNVIHENTEFTCDENECRSKMQPNLVYRIDPLSHTIREITLQKL